jgi:hypothetical protein
MAKKKISGLPAGSALNGTELVPIVQTGTTKRTTTQDIANLGNASGVEGSGTINTLAKFTASSTIGNSIISDNGTIATITGQLSASGADYHSLKVADGGAQLRLERTGSGAGLMYLGADSFGFKVFDSSFNTRAIITSAGNLGLGKTAPLGILHLYKAGATTRMVIDGDAAQSRIITYRTDGVQRFGFYVNNTAESGADAGSDFAIRAYSDAGTLLSTPLFIKRSSGNVLINTTTDAGYKLDVNGSARISGDAYFGTFNGNDKYYFEPFTNAAGGANNAYLVSSKDDNNERSGFVFQAKNSNGVEYNAVVIEGNSTSSTDTALTISGTREATFASSVTGAGLILTTNDSVFSTLASITKHTTIGLALKASTASVFDFSLYSVAGDVLISNATGTNKVTFNSGKVNIGSIPTSPAGLVAGDIYSNLGILTIV